MNLKASISLESIGLNGKDDIITIASTGIVSCNEKDRLIDVASKIVSTDHRRIPIVTKNGHLSGIITKSDILDAFLRNEEFDQVVENTMTREVITCNSTEDIEYVLQKFKISRRGGFPVINNNKLVGMISEIDFVKRVQGKETGIKVKDIMTKKPFVINSGISIHDCLKIMVNTHYRRLPVIDPEYGNVPIGLVTMADVLEYIHSNKYSHEALDEGLDKVVLKNVYTTPTDEDISQAVESMVSREVSGLVVVDSEKKLVGILTERDVIEEIE